MTPAEISALRTDISQHCPDLAEAADHYGIEAYYADTVTVPRPNTFVQARTMLASDPMMAATILGKLEAASGDNPVVRWALKFLQGEQGLDAGHPSTIGMIQMLATGDPPLLTMAERDFLLGLGQVTITRGEVLLGRTVTEYDARCALWLDNGEAAFG